jgi:hypothetical protein
MDYFDDEKMKEINSVGNNENPENHMDFKNSESFDEKEKQNLKSGSFFTKKKIVIICIVMIIFIPLMVIKSVRGCFIHNWRDATCTEPETCLKCGKSIGSPLGHSFNEATCVLPKTCSTCGETEGKPLGHSPGEWNTDTAATCTTKGTKSTKCTVCNETITEEIPLLQHIPGEWQISRVATISEKGEKQQKCVSCGKVLNTDTYELSTVEKMSVYKNQCQSYSYEQIARNPDSYMNKYAVFEGQVVQVMESSGTYVLRVNVTPGEYYWEDTIYVTYVKKDSTEPRILEDDIITMYGILEGTETYTAVLGNTITIPKMTAEYITIN